MNPPSAMHVLRKYSAEEDLTMKAIMSVHKVHEKLYETQKIQTLENI